MATGIFHNQYAGYEDEGGEEKTHDYFFKKMFI